jgi:hypothetical protein
MAADPHREDVAARLARLGKELSELEEVLTREVAAPEPRRVSLTEIYAFKHALDHMRRFLWLYVKVFSKPSQDTAATDLHQHLTAQMSFSSDNESLDDSAPLGFFEEVQDLVSGLLRKHSVPPQDEQKARLH